MARKKFKDGFKEEVLLYHETHSDETIKACAEKFDIGYSTLRRWIAEKENAQSVTNKIDNNEEKVVKSESTIQNDVDEKTKASNKESGLSVKEHSIEDEKSNNAAAEPFEPIDQEAVEVFYVDSDEFEDDEEGISQMDVLKKELKGMVSSVKNAFIGATDLVKLYKRRYYLCKVRNTLENETRKRYRQERTSEGEH